MRWIRLCFLVSLCVLLMTAVAQAAISEVSYTVNDDQISPAEQASFSLTIKNTAAQRQRFSIFSLEQGWNVDPSPLRDKIVDLAPGASHTTTILARPLEAFPPGIYYITILVESDLGERHSLPLKVYLGAEGLVDYLPSIRASLDMNEKLVPGDPVSIKLFLENRNPLDLKNLSIALQSEMPEFAKQVSIDLPPLDRKTVEFTVTPSEYQQPKNYILFFVFERGDQTVKVLEKKVEIVPVISEFAVDIKEETVFLKRYTQLTVRNEGNVLNEQEIKFPVSLWQALFVQGEGHTKVIDSQRYLIWERELKPGESITLNFATNYRLLLYILIGALLVSLFHLAVRSPLVLTKKAVTTKSGSDGALSEIKVTLELRNKRSAPLKHVSVTDLVPAIANVEKSLELGTLKPHEIRHTKHGPKVVWTLAELDGHEHRLITYKIKAKLNILGVFSLPRAIVEYRPRKGKKRKAYSNVFRLGN